jgi:hypothetical protein
LTEAFPFARVVLDLCGGTGAWSSPYRESGYDVRIIDPLADGTDVRLMERLEFPVHGVLAAPPCTHLAGSGARWWEEKGEEALLDALSIVDACLRIVAVHRPEWWCLENPVGRLSRFLGPPRMTFDPCDYGDPYTKRTCLWGEFNVPAQSPVPATEGSRMWRLPPSEDRWRLRSETPEGFAKAFFEANP